MGKECLAVKWVLEALMIYLLRRQFRFLTDHTHLKWMCDNKKKNCLVIRVFLYYASVYVHD